MTAFWDFSLALYARPGIPELLLDLQDTHDADVNLLLAILWRASLGQRLDVAPADARIRPWREQVIRPLRGVRRTLKPLAGDPAVAALRARVQADELEAERLQHAALQAMPAVAPGDAREGLMAYAASLARPIPAPAIEALLSCASA